MRTMTKKNKVLAAAGALALVAGGGGAAYAYWTTTGSGDGSATNSAGEGTVTLHATFDGGLAPGDFRTVSYTADNADPNTSTKVGDRHCDHKRRGLSSGLVRCHRGYQQHHGREELDRHVGGQRNPHLQ